MTAPKAYVTRLAPHERVESNLTWRSEYPVPIEGHALPYGWMGDDFETWGEAMADVASKAYKPPFVHEPRSSGSEQR